MRDNIQSFLLAAGNLGAEALCIIKLAEEKVKSGIDVMSALQAGIDKKYLKVDEKNSFGLMRIVCRLLIIFMFLSLPSFWNIYRVGIVA